MRDETTCWSHLSSWRGPGRVKSAGGPGRDPCERRIDKSARARQSAALIAAFSVLGLVASVVTVRRDQRDRRETVLHGPRVSVREVRAADAADLGATVDDVMMAAHGWTEAHRLAFVDAVAAESLPGAFAICDEDERVVGCVTAIPVPTRDRTVELGFWLGPGARGRGLAAEAMELVVDDLLAQG